MSKDDSDGKLKRIRRPRFDITLTWLQRRYLIIRIAQYKGPESLVLNLLWMEIDFTSEENKIVDFRLRDIGGGAWDFIWNIPPWTVDENGELKIMQECEFPTITAHITEVQLQAVKNVILKPENLFGMDQHLWARDLRIQVNKALGIAMQEEDELREEEG